MMFVAASLNPDYFKEKINLFVALAPVGGVAPGAKGIFDSSMSLESTIIDGYWRELQFLIKKLGVYDLFDFNWVE